ncbi:hypothetical protein Golomagni_00361 [Golovinomyces magnicellulatus]|nr:hypothetical protein Golomagni_00361 [Golovinomyces magnicellulatus]
MSSGLNRKREAEKWVQQTAFIKRMLEDTTTATNADLARFEYTFKSWFLNTVVLGEADLNAKLAMLQLNS